MCFFQIGHCVYSEPKVTFEDELTKLFDKSRGVVRHDVHKVDCSINFLSVLSVVLGLSSTFPMFLHIIIIIIYSTLQIMILLLFWILVFDFTVSISMYDQILLPTDCSYNFNF